LICVNLDLEFARATLTLAARIARTASRYKRRVSPFPAAGLIEQRGPATITRRAMAWRQETVLWRLARRTVVI
jgi:hypothetical protein